MCLLSIVGKENKKDLRTIALNEKIRPICERSVAP